MLPLKLGKEVYYQRVPFIAAQALVILDAVICRVTSVWRDYLNAIFSQFCAQLVSLKRAMTVQDSWHRLNHIRVESNLYQYDIHLLIALAGFAYRQHSFENSMRWDWLPTWLLRWNMPIRQRVME